MPSLLSRVMRAMDRICPLELAGKWDNVGLLVEAPNPRSQGTRVYLTIDLTRKVLDEIISDPLAGVIIAYHPTLFHSMKRLNMADEKQSLALLCAAHGISIFSPHTALDSCTGGINDWLARGLGDGECIPINSYENPPFGQEICGEGRLITLKEPVEISEMIERVKSHLNLKHCKLISKKEFNHLVYY